MSDPINPSTNKVAQSLFPLSLKPSSPTSFPLAYGDNIWDIIIQNSALSEFTGNEGQFDQHVINELLANRIKSALDKLSQGTLFLGEAQLETQPNTEVNGFYLALTSGTYTNFMSALSVTGISVAEGEIALLVRSGNAWAKQHVMTMPYIDSTTKHWIVDGQDSGVLAEGTTPHIDQLTGNWFIGDTDTGVHAQGVPGKDAVNPFKGWYNAVITGEAGSKVITSETQNLPANPVVGDSAYVKTLDISGTAPSQTETPIVKIYACATAGTWTDSGRTFNPAYDQSFASGQQVNEVSIVDNLESDNSDDMLSAKQGKKLGDNLGDFNAKKTSLSGFTDWAPSGSTSGNYRPAGTWNANANFNSTRVDVGGCDRVKFLGFVVPSSTAETNLKAFAFLDSNNAFVTGSPIIYDKNTTSSYAEKEYEVVVPQGASYLVLVNYVNASAVPALNGYNSRFYCILFKGESAKEVTDALKTRMTDAEGNITALQGDMSEAQTHIQTLDEQINGIHLPLYDEDASQAVTQGKSIDTLVPIDSPMEANRAYIITLDKNSPTSYATFGFANEEGRVRFYLNGSEETSYSFSANTTTNNIVMITPVATVTKVKIAISGNNITANGTIALNIHADAINDIGSINRSINECDKKKRDITSAFALKELIVKDNRGYFFDEFFDVDGSAVTRDYTSFEEFEDKSYLDNKIQSVPRGKHFIFTTDSHIDYYNLFPFQKETIIINYVKDRLGIKNVVFGGDAIGGPFTSGTDRIDINKYIGAKVLSTYANDKFNAFGSDFIYCQGNHDSNSPAALAAATYYRDNGGTEAQQKEALVYGFIPSVEVYKRTFRYLEEYGYAIFDKKMLDVIGSFDFTDYTTFKVYYGTDYYTMDALSDFGFTLETLKEEFKAWAKMHYYYDDDDQKIRYIVLETFDYGIVARMIGTGGYSLLPVEMDFLIDSLSTVKDGYDVVVVGHEMDAWDNKGYNLIETILSAYKNKSSVSNLQFRLSASDNLLNALLKAMSVDDSTSRSFDFTDNIGSGRVMIISGHHHYDSGEGIYIDSSDNNTVKNTPLDPENPSQQSDYVASSILSIRTDRATAGGQSTKTQEYLDARYAASFPDDVITEKQTAIQRIGTVTEVLFDVVTITDDNQVICTRFGGENYGGNDRVFTLPTPNQN